MVEIKKDNVKIKVTKNAFETYFKNIGFEIVDNKKNKVIEDKKQKNKVIEDNLDKVIEDKKQGKK